MVWYGIGMQDVKRMMENRTEVVISDSQITLTKSYKN
jgi:hypothetical protein